MLHHHYHRRSASLILRVVEHTIISAGRHKLASFAHFILCHYADYFLDIAPEVVTACNSTHSLDKLFVDSQWMILGKNSTYHYPQQTKRERYETYFPPLQSLFQVLVAIRIALLLAIFLPLFLVFFLCLSLLLCFSSCNGELGLCSSERMAHDLAMVDINKQADPSWRMPHLMIS